jgi:hypothetical protein
MSDDQEYTSIVNLGQRFGISKKAQLVLSNLHMKPVPFSIGADGLPIVSEEIRLQIAGATLAADEPHTKRPPFKSKEEWLQELGAIVLADDPTFLDLPQ